MRDYGVSNTNQAYAYILDCCLATVDDHAMKKRKQKREYGRHIMIAQKMINWAVEFGVDVSGTRADEVAKFGSVQAYADDIDKRFNKLREGRQ